MMNTDNSLRFRVKWTNSPSVQIIKLYLKGQPEKCVFYNGKEDPFFKTSKDDCLKHQLIEKRLKDAELGKKLGHNGAIKEVLFPKCLTKLEGPAPQTNFYNIFSSPIGKNLKELCIHGPSLTQTNSCIDFIQDIARDLTQAVAILNSGDKWYKHGSIYLPYIYLIIGKDNSSKIFLDNMKYEATKYEDKENMPFKDDFVSIGKQ